MRRLVGMGLAVAVVLAIVGCGGLNQDQVNTLQVGAMAARERASAFKSMIPMLSAKDGADAEKISAILKVHSDGLNAQALALDNLQQALVYRKVMNEVTVKAIQDCAKTSAERAVTWHAIGPKLISTNPGNVGPVTDFIAAHTAALDQQAIVLQAFANSLKKPDKKLNPDGTPKVSLYLP